MNHKFENKNVRSNKNAIVFLIIEVMLKYIDFIQSIVNFNRFAQKGQIKKQEK
jgi:hypothetical protein|tara:strand:- start:180 stop:338 length:159 start_codon:yes stop_codon:yes gene_type:complete